MDSLLTVAICMYNAELYIEETLQCIVKQTMQDFFLLIINDKSTDNSVNKIKEFFSINPRQYEIIHFEQNQGLAAGRKYVEDHATTKYILFIDADDCPYPQLVEKLYKKITSDEELIAVGCYQEFIDEKSKKMGGGIFLGETSKEKFWEKAKKGKLIFMQPTAIYDREMALAVGGHNVDGFPEGKPRYRDLCEDLDLWTRMSDLYTEHKAIIVIPEILCGYRKHQQAMSTNSEGMILRMKHIKNNVRRRRRGLQNLTFIEFTNQLSDEEKEKIRKEAISADSLRKGYYQIKELHLLSGFSNILKSIRTNPNYIIDKIKHNLLRIK